MRSGTGEWVLVDDLEILNDIAREGVRAAGVDPRLVFVRVRTAPDGDLVCESSDSSLLARVQTEVAARAVRPVDTALLPTANLTGFAAWVVASVAEVRRTPSHTAEQITQALQGEVLRPLLHEDGWVLGVLPDGYVGWVRDWHLRIVPVAAPTRFLSECDARVAIPWVQIHAAAQSDAAVVGETIHGTRVRRRARERDGAEVELPGGRSGWLPESALRAGCGDWARDVAALLSTLLRYQGVPYLWGGKSPKGFDCSGLVQFGFGLHGFALPRDADQQARVGVEVERAEAGDLIYFGRDRVTHIAVALDASRFVHARGEVRINALAAGTPEHDPELRALVRGVRRAWTPAA